MFTVPDIEIHEGHSRNKHCAILRKAGFFFFFCLKLSYSNDVQSVIGIKHTCFKLAKQKPTFSVFIVPHKRP